MKLHFHSQLKTPIEQVWQSVSNMAGINEEFAPWLKMTAPPGLETMSIEDAPLGEELFASWVTFVGIPIDRHFLKLLSVNPGRGFSEKSYSWTERVWIHERTLSPEGTDGCTITDHLEFEPRLPFLTPLVGIAVTEVFKHRHARLREKFGQL